MRLRGFTLVEMLVVLTISAILIAAAVPSFQWMIARNRVADATNLLLGNLEYARMEASRRGNTVSICRSLNPDAVAPACSSAAGPTADGNDWGVGWVVFEKVPPNIDEANIEAGDQLIFRQQALGDGLFRVQVHSNSGGAERIAYRPRGAGGIVGGAMTFEIDYGQVVVPVVATRPPSTTLTQAARCIPITLIGSLRVTRPVANACP